MKIFDGIIQFYIKNMYKFISRGCCVLIRIIYLWFLCLNGLIQHVGMWRVKKKAHERPRRGRVILPAVFYSTIFPSFCIRHSNTGFAPIKTRVLTC